MIGFRDAIPTRVHRIVGITVAVFALIVAGTASAKEPKTEEEKTLYFIGILMSRNFEPLDLTPAESKLVVQGLQDSIDGKAIEIDEEVYLEKVQSFANARAEASVEKEKAKSKEYLANAAKAKGAKTTESGLIYTETKAGSGTAPSATDTVRVHYHGTLTDGTVFDSSLKGGEPVEFPLNRVIPCWTEGVAMMKPGGKAKLVCPPELAYGDRGSPGRIPGGAALTFDVELIEVVGP